MRQLDTDTVPCGLFAFDEKGIVQRINTTLCDWLGYTATELHGQKVEMLLTLPSHIFYQTHLFPLLSMSGAVTEIFITLHKKNKEPVPVLLAGNKQIMDGATVYNCACITVYHRKTFEDELVAARQKADKALQDNTALQERTLQLKQRSAQLDEQLALVNQRNAELTQLSRVVTHELQEPLRKISIFSQMLTQNDIEPPSMLAAQQKLLRATGQMRSVVMALQQYIWLHETPVEYGMVNWMPLIDSVAVELRERFGSDTLELSVSPIPSVEGDARLLKVLLEQVLENAIQFRKEGQPARVTITATTVMRNRYRVLLGNYAYEDFIKIDISDGGVGFHPRYKTEVFELFRRLHHGQQRGVGLAISLLIVEKHGGVIAAHSEPQVGTTITIHLPIAAMGSV